MCPASGGVPVALGAAPPLSAVEDLRALCVTANVLECQEVAATWHCDCHDGEQRTDGRNIFAQRSGAPLSLRFDVFDYFRQAVSRDPSYFGLAGLVYGISAGVLEG